MTAERGRPRGFFGYTRDSKNAARPPARRFVSMAAFRRKSACGAQVDLAVGEHAQLLIGRLFLVERRPQDAGAIIAAKLLRPRDQAALARRYVRWPVRSLTGDPRGCSWEQARPNGGTGKMAEPGTGAGRSWGHERARIRRIKTYLGRVTAMPVGGWRRPCQGLHNATFLAYGSFPTKSDWPPPVTQSLRWAIYLLPPRREDECTDC